MGRAFLVRRGVLLVLVLVRRRQPMYKRLHPGYTRL
jgi:hypothetical protein